MKVTKLIPWPIRVSQAIGYFPISSSCVQNKLFFTFPAFWGMFLALLLIFLGVGFIYSWQDYTATLNTGDLQYNGYGDPFFLNVILGWSCWQTFVIACCRLSIIFNRSRMSELWFHLNELVAPLNLPADSLRALKLQWNWKLWLYTVLTVCIWTGLAMEESSFGFPFWTGILDIGQTAFSLLHMFSFHTLELFLQITNLAFDSAISTNSVNSKETIQSRKKGCGSSILSMIQTFWKLEDVVMEFNKVFHNRMVLEMFNFLIIEVLYIYFTINNFMMRTLSIGNSAGSVVTCMLFAYSVYSFCIASSAVTTKAALYLCELSKLAKEREGCNADPLISRRVE
jgi:hypothetical protein